MQIEEAGDKKGYKKKEKTYVRSICFCCTVYTLNSTKKKK